MATYLSERRQESKAIPGATFVLRKLTEGRRIELRKMQAEANKKMRQLLREMSQIESEPDETRDSFRYLELQDEFDTTIVEVVNPTWIRWGVKAVENLQVDGKSMTVDDMLEWPSEFFAEVLEAVKSAAGLSDGEQKNLLSPTTFGEQEGGTLSDISVPPVVEMAGSGVPTVDSTSQS